MQKNLATILLAFTVLIVGGYFFIKSSKKTSTLKKYAAPLDINLEFVKNSSYSSSSYVMITDRLMETTVHITKYGQGNGELFGGCASQNRWPFGIPVCLSSHLWL